MVLPRFVGAAVLVVLMAATADAQPRPERERARRPYEAGLDQMRQEAYDEAATSFEAAVAIDDSFDMAYYMLGRAHMARKQYAAAVYALVKCRNLHHAEATSTFANMQEAERLRRQRIQDLERLIGELRQAVPQTFRIQEQIRQFEERKRQVQDLDRNRGIDSTKAVPAFVSLSLGSAYFRLDDLSQAEKAYLAAIAADPKIGEAHNNLAVVYMETGRLDEAARSLKSAERAGFKVDPALHAEIRSRKR